MSNIYVGIGGWTYEPWRGPFYPDKLSQKKELEYAASKVTSIEINGTYYGAQKPESFRKWHDETPDGFVFAVKGTRYATNRKDLSQSKESVERFCASGISELKSKLGPINWQFMASKTFEADDFESFLKLLPLEADGVALKHAVEARHNSFRDPAFVDMCRHYNVGMITAADCEFPQVADVTADFAYLRLQGSSDAHELGYSEKALDDWAARIKKLAAGHIPEDMEAVTRGGHKPGPKDVYVYVISGDKVKNPAAAMALIERLK